MNEPGFCLKCGMMIGYDEVLCEYCKNSDVTEEEKEKTDELLHEVIITERIGVRKNGKH